MGGILEGAGGRGGEHLANPIVRIGVVANLVDRYVGVRGVGVLEFVDDDRRGVADDLGLHAGLGEPVLEELRGLL